MTQKNHPTNHNPLTVQWPTTAWLNPEVAYQRGLDKVLCKGKGRSRRWGEGRQLALGLTQLHWETAFSVLHVWNSLGISLNVEAWGGGGHPGVLSKEPADVVESTVQPCLGQMSLCCTVWLMQLPAPMLVFLQGAAVCMWMFQLLMAETFTRLHCAV